MIPIYFDHAATTPIDPDVLAAMLPHLRDEFGNASSSHVLGVRARQAVESARERVAAVANGRRASVVFTGSGTEANHLGIFGRFGREDSRASFAENVVVSAVEHPSVRENARELCRRLGIALHEIPVDAHGRLDLDSLASALTPKTALVAVMHVQNELGTLQPIPEIAALLRERAPRALLHVDAIQSLGKVDLAPVVAVADSIALSAHKVHAMKGVGALVTLGGKRLEPVLRGGGQEHGLRSGSENVAGIVGFGLAVQRALAQRSSTADRLATFRERIEACALGIPDVQILAQHGERTPAIVALRVHGLRGEILQHELEARGILVGTGSACHSGKREVSPTFTALGLDDEGARSVLRISLSRTTLEPEVDHLVAELPQAIARVRHLIH